MANQISVVMLTKDASAHLKEALEALSPFEEVIVLDNGSTDNTLQIAKSFENVTVYEHPFIGFGSLKNKAVSLASNDWILSMDSDEVLEQALCEEIRSHMLQSDTVYAIRRDNYYNGQLIRCCGWENDYVLRLFHRGHVRFNEKQVHESLVLNGAHVEKLHHPMRHYSYEDTSSLIAKMQHYSTLYAKENKGKKKSTACKAFGRALYAFVKHYLFQKGFLYGAEGLLISVSNANGVFYKYMKLREENRR